MTLRLCWDADGAVHAPAFLEEAALSRLEHIICGADSGKAGARLTRLAGIQEWMEQAGVLALASLYLAGTARAVRAILFDKSPKSNWSLGWHQDRTIAVASRQEAEGFDHWTRKGGVEHVEPPFSVIERMLTMRIHLDAVPANNAPLMIVRGSHRLGKLLEADLPAVASANPQFTCLAERGDVWLYRSSIVHASVASQFLGRRRVLQIDFSADELPPPLQWAGIT